jgi:arginine decarboxylase-like protein
MSSDHLEQTAQIEIAEDEWGTLAAVAWMGYQAKGRGLVVLDLEADEEEVSYIICQKTLSKFVCTQKRIIFYLNGLTRMIQTKAYCWLSLFQSVFSMCTLALRERA